MLELRKKLHDQACENILKAQQCQKKQYDAKHNTKTKLKVGDKVLVKSMKNEGRKGGKLKPQFQGGPYNFSEDLGMGRYRLKNTADKVLQQAVNCHRLKLWLDPQEGSLKRKVYIDYYNTLLLLSCSSCFIRFQMMMVEILPKSPEMSGSLILISQQQTGLA